MNDGSPVSCAGSRKATVYLEYNPLINEGLIITGKRQVWTLLDFPLALPCSTNVFYSIIQVDVCNVIESV